MTKSDGFPIPPLENPFFQIIFPTKIKLPFTVLLRESYAAFHWQTFVTNISKSASSIGGLFNRPIELTDFSEEKKERNRFVLELGRVCPGQLPKDASNEPQPSRLKGGGCNDGMIVL